MALPELAINAVSIVVRGAYNPAIFSPSWMLSNELIGSTEYEAAQVEAVTPALTAMQMDWLRLQATNDSFMVSTTEPAEFERTRDAAIGILQKLNQIPVGVMGINREIHFHVPIEEQWHAIGDILAPKEAWRKLLKLPGLLDLTILGLRSDSYAGRVQVQVQPSARIKPGVYIAHNDHYDLKSAESNPQSREDLSPLEQIQQPPETDPAKVPFAIGVLNDDWINSLKRAEAVIEQVANLTAEKK